ncbi:tyrosine-type recombinase/integrase [Rhodococcus sp. (in: high G+C Gram-positive bacteria)]|uniref:tyrosine-type recombinase/integrase n=1 Tax=Rhodococcus sp. TaxID=1831 RepID=UPI00388E785C
MATSTPRSAAGLRARHSRRQPLKTRGSETPIPIPAELADMLAVSVKKRPHDHVVTNGIGGPAPPWLIERWMRSVKTRVGARLPGEFSFHDLRHYLASLLIASGADIKTVQARMRHASAKTTLDVYGHLWPDADESTRLAVGSVIAARIDVISRGT